VQLASSNVSYDVNSQIFQADVTVQNLIGQALGTEDGTTAHPDGVRVFFHSGPVVTSGAGTAAVANASGTATFTESNQPYFQYDEILTPTETSSPINWQWNVQPTVNTFEFEVFVSSSVQYPVDWVDVSPSSSTIGVGETVQLGAVVRDALGREEVDRTVEWSSTDDGIATVESSTGLVSGVSYGATNVVGTSSGPESAGYVVDCLEAALWSFDSSEDFRSAILRAANLGDDADTTAAVCGQIAGAFYGASGIPADWLARLSMKDEIAELAGRLGRGTGEPDS
jgi:hypothetical protein